MNNNVAKPNKIKHVIWIIIIAVLVLIIYFTWGAFPGISGYGAKNLCSCIFIAGRDEQSVKHEELSDGFLKLGTFVVNMEDSSVTGSVIGLAKRKAIFREGSGCTLVNDITEKELREHPTNVPAWSTIGSRDTILEKDSINVVTSNINMVKINHAVNTIFLDTGLNKKAVTRAVVVLHDGKLLTEKYAKGFNESSRFLGWSMAKSITSALIGILVKDGKINVGDRAPLTEWDNVKDDRRNITIKHLLQQTSGLDFAEKYGRPSEVITMLFSKGNMAAFAASRPSKAAPGTVFNYTSGNTNILQGIIRKVIGEESYHAFPYTALLHKIGMSSAILETDAAGNFVGSSYIHASARDYAKFGLLYMNDGVWERERILPENWVKQTCEPASAEPQQQYGYQFWLNGFDKKDTSKRIFPGVPADLFYADGYGGQRIFIIPSRKLVVVRMGLHLFDEKAFLKEIVDAVSDQ